MKKMMKEERTGRGDRGVLVYIYVCYLYLTQLMLIQTKWAKGKGVTSVSEGP